jgi:hypothetical protein
MEALNNISSRRQWLKRGALFVPAAFAILKARGDSIQPGPIMRPMAVAVAGCTTDSDSALFDYTAVTVSGEDAVNGGAETMGQQFAVGSTFTLTEFIVNVYDINQTGDLTAALHADSSGSIGTVVADTTVTISNTAISDAPTKAIVHFVLASPKTGISSGTYWVKLSAATGSFGVSYCSNAGKRSYFSGAGGYINGYSVQTGAFGCV